MDTIGQRLRRARMSRALTQRELAERSGIPVVTISRIENDHYGMPRPRTVRELCHVLRMDPAWLLYGEQFPEVKMKAA